VAHPLCQTADGGLAGAVSWPLIYALLQDDFRVLYPLNPATLAKYREVVSPSRATDDPRDAA
jgi:hypothetical protein